MLCTASAVAAQCRENRQNDTTKPGFELAPEFGELTRWQRLDCGVRVFLNLPAKPAHAGDTPRDNVLVLFATPNGNTIEQTLGCAKPREPSARDSISATTSSMSRRRFANCDRSTIGGAIHWPSCNRPS